MRTPNQRKGITLNSIGFMQKSLLRAVMDPVEMSFGFYGPANAFNGLVEV